MTDACPIGPQRSLVMKIDANKSDFRSSQVQRPRCLQGFSKNSLCATLSRFALRPCVPKSVLLTFHLVGKGQRAFGKCVVPRSLCCRPVPANQKNKLRKIRACCRLVGFVLNPRNPYGTSCQTASGGKSPCPGLPSAFLKSRSIKRAVSGRYALGRRRLLSVLP